MSDPTETTSYHRPVRGLEFGLSAVGLRALSIVSDLPAMHLIDLAVTALALVGVSYSAVAAYRREWGVVLVVAWACSLAAALCPPPPFVHTLF